MESRRAARKWCAQPARRTPACQPAAPSWCVFWHFIIWQVWQVWGGSGRRQSRWLRSARGARLRRTGGRTPLASFVAGNAKLACVLSFPYLHTSQNISEDARAQREPMAPFYSRHALAAYPARTPLAGLSAGYAELARSLPIGSGAMLLALRRLAARAGELLSVSGEEALGNNLGDSLAKPLGTARSGGGNGGAGRFDSGYQGLRAGWRSGGSGGSGPGASGPAAPGREAREDRAGAAPGQAEADAGLDLVRLLAQLLLIVDLQVCKPLYNLYAVGSGSIWEGCADLSWVRSEVRLCRRAHVCASYGVKPGGLGSTHACM